MVLSKIYLFVIITTLFYFCLAEGEEEEDDYPSEDISQKLSKLRAEGAEYLKKVMNQLQNDRYQVQQVEVPDPSNLMYTQRVHQIEYEGGNYVTPIYNISGPTPVPNYEAEIVPEAPPPLTLSKEELLALYEAALVKASQVQGETKPAEESFHTPEIPSSGVTDIPVKPALQGQMGSPVSGYYYYYFPIKSFVKPAAKPSTVSKTTTVPPQQLHATITMLDSANNKSVEPLFMAISGFIGMALMFIFSIFFVPKFGKLRSKNAQFKDTPDDMATYATLILEAMAGRDCSERFACEVARIFRGLKSNNKPLRILEIILPPKMSQQVSRIRKAAGKKAKCGYIPCKIKKPKPAPQKPQWQSQKPQWQGQKPQWQGQNQKPQGQNQKPKLVKKKETTHDLWMKNFEKQKVPAKKQPTWTRKPPVKKT